MAWWDGLSHDAEVTNASDIRVTYVQYVLTDKSHLCMCMYIYTLIYIYMCVYRHLYVSCDHHVSDATAFGDVSPLRISKGLSEVNGIPQHLGIVSGRTMGQKT